MYSHFLAQHSITDPYDSLIVPDSALSPLKNVKTNETALLGPWNFFVKSIANTRCCFSSFIAKVGQLHFFLLKRNHRIRLGPQTINSQTAWKRQNRKPTRTVRPNSAHFYVAQEYLPRRSWILRLHFYKNLQLVFYLYYDLATGLVDFFFYSLFHSLFLRRGGREGVADRHSTVNIGKATRFVSRTNISLYLTTIETWRIASG